MALKKFMDKWDSEMCFFQCKKLEVPAGFFFFPIICIFYELFEDPVRCKGGREIALIESLLVSLSPLRYMSLNPFYGCEPQVHLWLVSDAPRWTP